MLLDQRFIMLEVPVIVRKRVTPRTAGKVTKESHCITNVLRPSAKSIYGYIPRNSGVGKRA